MEYSEGMIRDDKRTWVVPLDAVAVGLCACAALSLLLAPWSRPVSVATIAAASFASPRRNWESGVRMGCE